MMTQRRSLRPATFVAPDAQREIEALTERVARSYGVPVAAIYQRNRESIVASARYVAMYLALRAGHSTTLVGAFFDRDHSTVVYARKRIERWLDLNPQIRETVISLGEAA